ncbi:hypothetical protein ABVN80_14600 [Acinetobacter baumannii]
MTEYAFAKEMTMASDVKNVKLGVCKIMFDGVDLGFTKAALT